MEKLNLEQKGLSPLLISLLEKGSQTLSQAQEAELKAFCDKYNLRLENPVNFDFIKFKGYLAQIEKCRNCDGTENACSAREIYVENGHLRTKDIGCPIKKAKQIIQYSGVPVKFKSCRAGDFRITPANVDAVAGILGTSIRARDSLYIYGDAGTGKTMLSSIIANERAYLGARSSFYTVTDMLDDLRDFTDAFRREEKLTRLKTSACLIIDDLGAENVTEWVASTLFSIIDFRYKNTLQTIFNSNFDINELCNRYPAYHGNRISRRIKAMCKIIYIK